MFVALLLLFPPTDPIDLASRMCRVQVASGLRLMLEIARMQIIGVNPPLILKLLSQDRPD